MQAGGNAVDGLVAAAFTSFVTEQVMCTLGGYAHISLWLAERGEFVSVDAYARAPLAARADMFQVDEAAGPTYYGHPPTMDGASEHGALAVAVPGAVAGFCDAHALGGRLPLAAAMAPAIEAAEAGVPFTWYDKLKIAELMEPLRAHPDAAAVLLPGGRLPRTRTIAGPGDSMDTADLARTLRLIAAKGRDGFYRGRIARALSGYVQSHGGILSSKDLSGYQTRVLYERPLSYRDCRYVACYDQVAYEALNILDQFDLARCGPDSYEYRHLAAEALAIAFTDSIVHYGDPEHVPSPVNGLASPAYAAARRRLIRFRRALPRPVGPGNPWLFEEPAPAARALSPGPSLAGRPGTSQVAVADRSGNMASACISVGEVFGSLTYVPGTGVFLNNAMRNYDPRSGYPCSIAPGKMPLFGAPAMVATRAGKAVFAASGSGGYRIETGVLHTFMNVVDHGMSLQRAIDHPRVHSQGSATVVDPRIPEAVQERLRRAGHALDLLPEIPGVSSFGRVCAVAADPRRRVLTGAGGPAWGTTVAGY
jgi:gamma-glutamyltranspeptidase/glutathione hydrolase